MPNSFQGKDIHAKPKILRKRCQYAMTKHKRTFIDLFAGCGGLSLGLLNAGWHGVLAVEKCKDAFSTLEHNLVRNGIHNDRRPKYDWPVSQIPIEPFTTQEFLLKHEKWITDNRGTIDLLAGGPPCQGFSFAGTRNPNDLRNELYRTQIEIAKHLEPKIVLIENVAGINSTHKKFEHSNKISAEKKSYADIIAEELRDIGYKSVQQGIIVSSDFGVPQRRPRFFTIAFRTISETARYKNIFDLLIFKRKSFLGRKGLRKMTPVTISEAISDMEIEGNSLVECNDPLSPKGFQELESIRPLTSYQKLMHSSMNGIKPNSMRLANHRDQTKLKFRDLIDNCRHGKNLTSHEKLSRGIKKHMLTVLDPDLPSPTLTTLPDDILHYSEPRILTPREYARVQSFPDWFTFLGKYTTGGKRRLLECPRYTQIGNAIPPLMAEIVGEALLEMLTD
jgi:DNA (cytosine-5)-methyltransferase 1